MRQWLLAVLISTSNFVIAPRAIAESAVVEVTMTELDPLFTDKNLKPKASADAWPDDLPKDLNNPLNDSVESNNSDESGSLGEAQEANGAERDVASTTKWKKSQKAKNQAAQKIKADAKAKSKLKAKPKTSPALSAPGRVAGRRSHMPSGVKNGFELRVKASGIITTFWVTQRGTRQDLQYANSSGSKASLPVSPANFRVLQAHAVKIPPSDTSVKACPDSNMQIHVLEKGVERTSTYCVNAKSEGAEKLRNLGNTLVVWVR